MKVLLSNSIGESGDYLIRLREEEDLSTKVKLYYIEAFKHKDMIGKPMEYSNIDDALKAYWGVIVK